MKKFIALACAAVLTVASAVTAFAQPSVSVNGVASVQSATDKNGNAVNVTVSEVPAEYASAVAEVKTADKLKELLGSEYTSTMQVVDVKDVTVPAGAVFPVTITFKISGVTAKVAVLHYNTTTKAWEKVESKAGEGTITATFTSLSPVAFVVDKATASSTTVNKGTTTTTTNKGTTSSTTGSKTTSSTTSPKTGETNVMMYAGIVAVAAFAGMAVTRRKRA
mgnify:CR=1 FL=1